MGSSISQLIQSAWTCSSNVLFWGPGDFPESYSNRDTSWTLEIILQDILLRNECLFLLGSWRMNWSTGQTNCVNSEAVLWWLVCSACWFIPHEPRKKDTHSFCLQCFQQRKTLSKIIQETSLIKYSNSNGYLTSFYVFITVCVICLAAELLVDSGYWELNWKI